MASVPLWPCRRSASALHRAPGARSASLFPSFGAPLFSTKKSGACPCPLWVRQRLRAGLLQQRATSACINFLLCLRPIATVHTCGCLLLSGTMGMHRESKRQLRQGKTFLACSGLLLMAMGMAGLGYAAQRVIVATARKAAHEALLERTSTARESLVAAVEDPQVGKAALGLQSGDTSPRTPSAETLGSQIAMVKAVEVGAPQLRASAVPPSCERHRIAVCSAGQCPPTSHMLWGGPAQAWGHSCLAAAGRRGQKQPQSCRWWWRPPRSRS